MKKALPKSLVERQELERAATVSAVTEAILELESQGYSTRIKDLIFVTGFSRSLFAKPHIRQVLIEHGVVEPRETTADSKQEKGEHAKNYAALLAEKNGYIDRLLHENERLKHECEILRGEIHLLMSKKHNEEDDF